MYILDKQINRKSEIEKVGRFLPVSQRIGSHVHVAKIRSLGHEGASFFALRYVVPQIEAEEGID